MRDRYNEPDIIDRFNSWTETRSVRILGRRAQKGLGVGVFVAGAAIVADGIWNHEIEQIFYGTTCLATGSFLAKFAQVQLEKIHEEVPRSNF